MMYHSEKIFRIWRILIIESFLLPHGNCVAFFRIYGSVSKPIVPLLFTSKELGFMDVNNPLKMVLIGIDP
jgi:hypothetical protein